MLELVQLKRFSRRFPRLALSACLVLTLILLSNILLSSSNESNDLGGGGVGGGGKQDVRSPLDSDINLHAAPLPASKFPPGRIAVLVIACNRPAVARCLDSLLKYRPENKFPIIVSQDCEDEPTTEAIKRYADDVMLIKQPDKENPVTTYEHRDYVTYYRIARHYKWALDQLFHVLKFEQVIIVEDDLEVAPDFFDYFEAFSPLLQADRSLYCVSAWNDNGKAGLVHDSNTFYRSEFFPGLGWMLTSTFWEEIRVKWPKTYWDDWLRHPLQRLGRACIRPQISRTSNFGKKGASGGQFYDEHIGRVVLNQNPSHFMGMDIETRSLANYEEVPFSVPTTRLKPAEYALVDVRRFFKGNYDEFFRRQVYELSSVVSSERMRFIVDSQSPSDYEEYAGNRNIIDMDIEGADYRDVKSIYYCGRNCRRRFTILFDVIEGAYKNRRLYHQIAILKDWDLMEDIREDVARVSYKDVVAFTAKMRQLGKAETTTSEEEYVTIFIAPRK